MNNTIIKIKLFALSLLVTGGLMAQQKLEKVSQSIKVNKDVTIDLNTSHCNLVIDTWNKDAIEIEAYIEGDELSKEALENALKNWDVDVDASSGLVKIKTKGTGGNSWVYNSSHNDNEAVHALLEELKFELADLPEVLIDGVDFVMPEVPELPEMPQLPVMPELPELPKLPEGVNEIHFDYKAYKKDGEKYLEEYTQKFESKFGKDYAEKMEAWGEKFGKEWGEKYGKQMEAWGEKFGKEWEEKYGKQMEEWGERFAEKMESQAERIEARAEQIERRKEHAERRKEHMEKHAEKRKEYMEKHVKALEKRAANREKLIKNRKVLIERLVNKESNSKIKRTIKIKMPKKAKLKVNVRHGEIEFAANVDDLKAELSHTKFTAYSINGSSTSVNASYSPVYVTYWNLGELNLRYTKDVELGHVKHMVLNSNSSNITIKNLLGSAMIDGNIGDLKILDIGDTFSNLNIIIQNSNAVISLPKVNYNLQYKGNRSHVSHPKEKLNHNISNFSTGSLASGKSILVNAKYSHVIMQ
ncbi:hypothetical protein [Flavivirga rizhaonensis]|uniref:Adhesin domain-containing protein n=1 Tax=Flavivirga rizhaonensis TaxID=2559571 RepID=A0A4S1DS84_9FLAO|nr:hypothetical protein [Flavivirga rizhaonensis]TGV00826.1 hypothetical protein EM932_18040 [Flavivirga rizhaonensis]